MPVDARSPNQIINLGIAGLGVAGSFMIRAAEVHPKFSLVAAADLLETPRNAFERRFNARSYTEFERLCEDPNVDAIYIATPHKLHAAQAILAMESGKDVLIEKPLALNEEECKLVLLTQHETQRVVVVGHTHGFDSNIRAMRDILNGGILGTLGMILSFNYNDFVVRAHQLAEFLDDRTGGIVLNQMSHQVEIMRMLGGEVKSVRASMSALDPLRSAAGHCATLLTFNSGAIASVIFSGYDFFDSDEFFEWVSEDGTKKTPFLNGRTRSTYVGEQESLAHDLLGYGSRLLPTEQPYLPHFGVTIVTCERGDMRLTPAGILIHGTKGNQLVDVVKGEGRPGQGDALDEFWSAIKQNVPALHNVEWGTKTLKVLHSIIESSRSDREVSL